MAIFSPLPCENLPIANTEGSLQHLPSVASFGHARLYSRFSLPRPVLKAVLFARLSIITMCQTTDTLHIKFNVRVFEIDSLVFV